MGIIALLLFYLFFPLVILHVCHKVSLFRKIGTVVTAYTAGFILGNVGLLPLVEGYSGVQGKLTMLTIPLAIPLMLFSMDIRMYPKMAGKMLLSALFALVAVLLMVFTGYFIFRGQEMGKLSDIGGMLVGLYTGSTANLAAIKIALNADESTYVLVAAYDLLIGAFHLLFVLTIAQRLALTFLPKYRFLNPAMKQTGEDEKEEPFMGLNKKHHFLPLLKVSGVALVIFGISGGITLFLPESSQTAAAILVITSLGIAASLIPFVNKTEKSFELGMYLILIFCLVIASMADISKMNFVSLSIAAYVTFVVFGSMLIQAGLSWLFKVDADTFLITSTAFISNAGVVPVVASALKNREVMLSGITVGIIGIAIGNYFGVLMAWILERM
jgi:uncharacterized membrane protein